MNSELCTEIGDRSADNFRGVFCRPGLFFLEICCKAGIDLLNFCAVFATASCFKFILGYVP